MPGSGGVEPKGAIPEKGKNVGLSIMGYRFAPGSTFLHSHPCRLQRVTANYVLATAGAHLSSACHCEPVRTLVRQSVFPAAIPGKSVVLRANSQLFRIRREELLFGLCCRRSYGLPRRFAPRNDRGEVSLRATFLHPCTRPSFCMSLRTSAHTGAAIRFPAGKPGKLAAV